MRLYRVWFSRAGVRVEWYVVAASMKQAEEQGRLMNGGRFDQVELVSRCVTVVGNFGSVQVKPLG